MTTELSGVAGASGATAASGAAAAASAADTKAQAAEVAGIKPGAAPGATRRSDAPVYEAPVRGVRLRSRRRTRRLLSWMWLTQAAISVIIPCAVAALGYREWADVPSLILMLVGAGAIAILPYWFMAGRVLLDKDEGWEVPSSTGGTGPGETATGTAAADEDTHTNPR